MKKKKNKNRAMNGTPSFSDYRKLPPRPKKYVRVWFDNYLDFLESGYPLSNLPTELQHEHGEFMQLTDGCTSLRSYYNSDYTKRKLEKYLINLNRFLANSFGDHLSGVTTNPLITTTMQYDQEYINGLGAVSRRSYRSKKRGGKATAPKAPARSSKRRHVEDDEEEETNPKHVSYKKRKYNYETVDTVSESVKFIRRFVNLVNQKIETKRLVAFIRALQRAIVQRQIRKTSPHAKVIATIQEIAIDAYKTARAGHVFVSLDEGLRDKYYEIGRGEKVRGSVAILKRFVGLVGYPFTTDLKRRIENILASLNFQYKKGITQKNDPYYEKLKEAENAMKKALRDRHPVSVSNSALNGIHGIIEYETQDSDFFEQGGTDLNGIEEIENAEANEIIDEPQSVPAALTGEQLRNMQFDTVKFPGFHGELLGQAAKNCFMLVYGPPWHGKSAFAISLSKCYAENVGKVAYISPEQHGTLSQQALVAAMDAFDTPGLEWFADLPAAGDLKQYACIVIDSGNAYGLSLGEAIDLKGMLPNSSLIVILQSTKDDDFKGEQGWRHDPDIVLKVKDKQVHTEKNRYRTDAVSLPIPMPEQFPATKEVNDQPKESLAGRPISLQPGEIEITAEFDAPLQWIAETVFHKAEGLDISTKINKKPAKYEKAVRVVAEKELEETGVNVRLYGLQFSHVDKPGYFVGTAYFEVKLRGMPADLRRIAGDDGTTVFLYKWKSGALKGKPDKPEMFFELGSIEQSEIPEVTIHFKNPIKFESVLRSSDEVVRFLRTIFDEEEIEVQEQMIVLYLNRGNKVIGYYKHTKGGINSTLMDVRLILAAALKSLSSGLIIAHNHPSGSVKPSQNDIYMTRRLSDAAKIMDITLLDSVILSPTTYFSFANDGIL